MCAFKFENTADEVAVALGENIKGKNGREITIGQFSLLESDLNARQ
jgi:hypothetical protein